MGCLTGFNITMFYRNTVFNANRIDSDQTPCSVAFDLGIHCLPMYFFYETLGINAFIVYTEHGN